MKTVLLAIRSLNPGGAERQMIELAKGLAKEGCRIVLCTFYKGAWDNELAGIAGIETVCLNKKNRWNILSPLLRYRRLVRETKPDVIYAFLPEMNLFSLLANSLSRSQARLFWGIRASNMATENYGRVSKAIIRLQALLSRFPDGVIFNSFSGRDHHLALGFKPRQHWVVPNGIDTEKFKPDAVLRTAFRDRHNLADDTIAIGMAARLDPMKGYPVFCAAAALIAQQNTCVRFFSAGTGDSNIQAACVPLLGRAEEKFTWLGKVDNMAEFYNGIDIALSASSYGEGFSNAIAEAMACATPCIATDVGDNALIVDNPLLIAPPDNPSALAGKLSVVVQGLPNTHPGLVSRRRIQELFDTAAMVRNTLNIIFEKTIDKTKTRVRNKGENDG